MSFEIVKAQRAKTKLKIAMTGASGSGKTMSALKLARGLTDSWDKICVIDTEQGSASLYAELGQFNSLPFAAPFHPKRFIEAIKLAEKSHDIIIIDSASHEWDGPGGCLELHGQTQGRFQDWKLISPLHKSFIDAILQSPAHIIATLRAKSDYQLDKDEGTGKTKVAKIGLKATQREGFDYEVSIEFRLNEQHRALATKDRTNLFAGNEIPFLIDEGVGKRIRDWNDSGEVTKATTSKNDSKSDSQNGGKKEIEVYTGTTEQQEKIRAHCVKENIAETFWADIDANLMNKPFTPLAVGTAIHAAGAI